MSRPSYPHSFDQPNNIWWGAQVTKTPHSSAGIATGSTATKSGFDSRKGKNRFFYTVTNARIHPASYPMGTRGSFPGGGGGEVAGAWN
jgi:hypothetical protein